MSDEHFATATHTLPSEGKTTADESGAASLDKVRDILFGAQARDTDRRFTRLEDVIARETAELKDAVRRRLGALEEQVQQEFESLAQRRKNGMEARGDADPGLSRELRDRAEAGDRKVSLIDDQVGRVQRELRQQLLEAQQTIRDEIQRHAQEHASRLTRESTLLRNDKLDRAEFAAMLTELALRMTDRLSPGADGE